jgi:hypothetical protein
MQAMFSIVVHRLTTPGSGVMAARALALQLALMEPASGQGVLATQAVTAAMKSAR